ncbi:MAG: translocation/assembly module TamB domain-containing protein [Paludibacteraceae bacterium]|nr:translocation/assembly module TamB domain-containing protein [Paludibacteraceae bacterium]
MKRFLYILSVLLVSVLLVCMMILAALSSDRVETAAVQLATEELSRALGTHAKVGAVEYRFPARLAIRDIYIEDQQQDTLAFLEEVYAHFRPLSLRDGEIRFSHVRVAGGVAKIYRKGNEHDGDWNYQFLVDAFRSQNTPKENSPLRSLIAVEDIRLDSLRIAYADYTLLLPKARMDLHQLTDQTVDAEIREMLLSIVKHNEQDSTTADSRLDVLTMQAHVQLTDSVLKVPTLSAQLPHSRLDLSGIEITYPANDTLYLSNSVQEMIFAAQLHEASIVPSDLQLFIPQLAGLNREVCMTGKVTGSLDSLQADNLSLTYNNQQVFIGDVSLIGLTNLNNTYLRANFQDVHTNAAMLQDMLSQLYQRPIRLPKETYRFGDVHYRGLAEGKLHDLTLHGAFRTAIGTITTDGKIKSDSLFENMEYDAQVVGKKLRLGKLIGYAPLQKATLDIRSQGHINNGRVSGDVQAHTRQLTYNGYSYQDMHINGRYEPQRYSGDIYINDPHLYMAFNGTVDLHEHNPEINFDLDCRHFDSTPLFLAKDGKPLESRFKLAIDMEGSDPDRMSGYMVLDSLFLATSRDSVLMQQLTLLVSADGEYDKSISLKSDYLTAEIDGTMRYRDLFPAMQAMLHHYIPTAIPAPKRKWQDVYVSLQADGKRLRDLQKLYTAPVTLSDHPTLRAMVQIPRIGEPQVFMRFFAPGVRAGNTPLHDLRVEMNTVDTLRHTNEPGSGLALSVSAEAHQMRTVLSTLAFRDTLLTHITLRQQTAIDTQLPEGWRELTPRQLQRALSDLSFRERQHALLTAQRAGTYGGDVHLVTHFSQYNKRPLVDLHIRPSTLLLRDSVYRIGESHITYCAADTSVSVDHFLFDGGGQHLIAHGIASPRKADTLAVDLKKINAGYVVPFFLPVQTIMFNGLLSGQAQIAGAMKQPAIEAQVHVDSMGLNNCWFGDAEVDLHIYPKRHTNEGLLPPQLQFHAEVDRPTRHVVSLDGEAIFDGSGKWKLDMDADSVPLAFVNHWTSSVLTDLDGNASGKVVVGGRKGLTYVLLRAVAQNGAFTLPWTGGRYIIPNDSIVMDTTAIIFPEVHAQDIEGNPVGVVGAIYHDQFKDFQLDLHVDVDNALAFDKPDKEGELLQGRVYATGHVDVTGKEDDILVTADARTSGKSRFRLSLDNTSNAYESNFIHFVENKKNSVSQDTVAETDLDNIDIIVNNKKDSIRNTRAGRCQIALNLEVNPLLLFQLVLGVRNGDMIQARGNGALRLTYDTQTGDVRLLGTYDIDQGTLSYTVANVIRREFTVGTGSSIIFSGDVTNPQLDVTAQYKVTANLKDLFGDEIDQVGTTRTNIPVLTCLRMTGTLNNPVLNFSLELPLSDQTIQQQVQQVINTDEMLMRQVIYLLVFGRFFTPDYMSQAQYATLNSTYSLLSSTVTGQINAWLSKLTDILTLGVAIRTDGEGAGASQEYEAQFQLQPVDRLVINGNVGYRYNDISNQPFFGDLDVELLLTEDGQFRLKGYTHTVDKYSLRQASTMQGVGLLWKKDFNWPTRGKSKIHKKPRKTGKK